MITRLIIIMGAAGLVESFSVGASPFRRSSFIGNHGSILADRLLLDGLHPRRRSADPWRRLPSTATSSMSASTLEYDIDSWSKGYEDADPEDQYLMEPSEGSIPEDIEGTWFRNGPAKFKVGNDLVKHPFDGDGMVMAISFSKEGAYFRNRFVRTKGFVKELEAGKQLYRGFSNLPGGPLRNAFRIGRKNLANTNVHFWGGNLLALWEGGLPYRLDAKSLDTLGETNLGGTIDKKRPTFTAHPRIDVTNQRLVGFGSHNMQEVTLYEYDKNFKLVQSRLMKDVKGLLHDFVVTDDHYVFYSGPIGLNPLTWVLGLDNMGSAIKWEGKERGATVYVVPRDPSKTAKTIDIPAGFCFHLANGFQDPNTGELVLDVVESEFLMLDGENGGDEPLWENVDFPEEVPKNKLQRYRMDLSSPAGAFSSKAILYNQHLDFPVVSCREHRYVWAACGRLESEESCPGQGVVKIDTQTGTVEKWLPLPHEFMGECNFIPRKGATADAPEDSGYLISVLVNGRDHRTDVLIFDAAEVSKGPVCRLPLKGFVGHTLHGSFAPDLVFTPAQVEKSFALTDLFGRKGWNVAKSEFSGLGLNSVLDG
ncbi:unnamed protein product [Ascophyllum nodosum]